MLKLLNINNKLKFNHTLLDFLKVEKKSVPAVKSKKKNSYKKLNSCCYYQRIYSKNYVIILSFIVYDQVK